MLPARTHHRRGPLSSTLPDVLDQFQRDFDTIVEQFFEPTLERGWSPTGVEIWEDDQKVYIVAEMPGVKAEDIDITLDNNVLTIRGQKKEARETPEKTEDIRWHMRQRSYGQFMRQFQLPPGVDESKVNASFKDGLLHIDIEKRPEVKPKRIEVKPE
jgi:HSP20 family protein